MSAPAAMPVHAVRPDYRPWHGARYRDPLNPFMGGTPAPYVFRVPKTADVVVLPVRCKTDLAATRFGTVHHSAAVASVMEGNRVRMAARWACGGASSNVALVADAGQFGSCLACEDKLDPLSCVYFCLDAAGGVLYIGSTGRRRQRFHAHERKSGWWPQVADIKLQPFPTILEARIAEARAIRSENPPCNKSGRAA